MENSTCIPCPSCNNSIELSFEQLLKATSVECDNCKLVLKLTSGAK